MEDVLITDNSKIKTVFKKDVDYDKELLSFLANANLLKIPQSQIVEGVKIGKGGYGKVIMGFFKSLKLAIKKLKKYDSKSLFRELTIMNKYSHPHIPKLYGIVLKPGFDKNLNVNENSLNENVFDDLKLEENQNNILNNDFKKSTNSFEIALEIVEGESLETMLKTRNLHFIQKLVILIELSTVLEYLHNEGLIHRDLKPANMMINKYFDLKLLDFGISKISQQNQANNTVSIGTVMYMAPENFEIKIEDENDNEEKDNEDDEFETIERKVDITNKVDIWAFGCIVNEMFGGVKPWANKAKNDSIVISFLYSKRKFEVANKIVNSEIRNLIELCTQIDPNSRINITDARNILEGILFDECKVLFKETNTNDNLAKRVLNFMKVFDNMLPKQQNFFFQKLHVHLFKQYLSRTKNSEKKYSFMNILNLDKDDAKKNPNFLKKLLNKFKKIELEKKEKMLVEQEYQKKVLSRTNKVKFIEDVNPEYFRSLKLTNQKSSIRSNVDRNSTTKNVLLLLPKTFEQSITKKRLKSPKLVRKIEVKSTGEKKRMSFGDIQENYSENRINDKAEIVQIHEFTRRVTRTKTEIKNLFGSQKTLEIGETDQIKPNSDISIIKENFSIQNQGREKIKREFENLDIFKPINLDFFKSESNQENNQLISSHQFFELENTNLREKSTKIICKIEIQTSFSIIQENKIIPKKKTLIVNDKVITLVIKSKHNQNDNLSKALSQSVSKDLITPKPFKKKFRLPEIKMNHQTVESNTPENIKSSSSVKQINMNKFFHYKNNELDFTDSYSIINAKSILEFKGKYDSLTYSKTENSEDIRENEIQKKPDLLKSKNRDNLKLRSQEKSSLNIINSKNIRKIVSQNSNFNQLVLRNAFHPISKNESKF